LFGLNFNGAEHVDGKWTVKFTSQKLTSPEDEQGGQILEMGWMKFNGTPTKTKEEEPKAVKAFSIREMIKTQKDDTVNKLKTINGEKND